MRTCLLKVVLFLFVLSSFIFAAGELRPVGTSFMAAGSAGKASGDAEFAVFLNPALIVGKATANLNLYYKNFYQIENLDQINLEARFRLRRIPIVIGVGQYGAPKYGETEVRLGTALRLHKSLSLGISANIYSVSVTNYGHNVTTGLGVGLYYQMTRRLAAAFVADNLNEPEIGKSKESIPAHMTFALGYKATSNVKLLLDLAKEPDYDFDVRMGLVFNLNKYLDLRAGFKTAASTFGSGISLNFRKFKLSYAFEYNQDLGVSSALGFSYNF